MNTTTPYLVRATLAMVTLIPLAGCTPEQIVGGMAIASGAKKGFYITKGQPTYHDWNAGAGNIAQVLPEADPKTFRALKPAKKAYALYAVDSQNAYIADNYTARQVPGADGATFELLTGDGSFCRDSEHVYYFGAPLVGADPSSFEPLTFPFGQDDSRAFIGPVSIPVQDVESWRPLERGSIGDVWYRSHRDCHVVDYSDLLPRGWSQDSHHAYFGNKLVKGVDVSTLVILPDNYAKDKDHVYKTGFSVKVLEAADVDTFEVLPGGKYIGHIKSRMGPGPDAKDANRTYRSGEVYKPK